MGSRRSRSQMYLLALSGARQKLSLRTAVWAASLCAVPDERADHRSTGGCAEDGGRHSPADPAELWQRVVSGSGPALGCE